MEKFWRCHNPCARSWSRQYRSAVFYAGEEQKKIAEETRAAFEKERGKTHTAVEPLKKFYWAEDYHQKYTLRRHKDICQELERCYPRLEDFVNSTAATRVNSYLSGYGTKAQLEAEIGKLGISEESKSELRERVSK